MLIRKETPADIPAIHALVCKAFGKDAEAQLVDDLRANGNLSVSLVALENDAIVGHIAFSPMSFEGTLGLAPLAVSPSRQKSGIGSALMKAGIAELKARNTAAVFVLGHDKYYPRFGFVPAATFGIRCAYPDTENHFFAMEMKPDALKGKSGLVQYAPEFAKL